MRNMRLGPEASLPPLGGGGRIPRILVVEDVDTTRRRICAALRSAGYQVEEATNGADGWRLLSSSSFDAVLLDLVMPHLDGWQFRQHQLEIPALASIPTMIVTARPLTEPDKYALRARAVIQKPFEDDTLIATVASACRAAWGFASGSASAGAEQALATKELFWSRRGEVACSVHAPASGSERWVEERWTAIPLGAGRDRISYQCQHCSGNGPIRHRTLSGAHA